MQKADLEEMVRINEARYDALMLELVSIKDRLDMVTDIQLDLVQAVKGLTSKEVEAKYYQVLDRHREELGLAPLRRILRPSLD